MSDWVTYMNQEKAERGDESASQQRCGTREEREEEEG